MSNKAKYILFFLAVLLTILALIFQPLRLLLDQNDPTFQICLLLLTIPFLILYHNLLKIFLGFNFQNIQLLLILTISIYFSGIVFSAFTLIYILAAGYLLKMFLRPFQIHFQSKIALIYGLIFAVFLAVLPAINSVFLGVTSDHQYLYYFVLTFFFQSLLIEKLFQYKLLNDRISKELKTTVFYYIAAALFLLLLGINLQPQLLFLNGPLTDLLSVFPDLVFVTLLLIVILGKYTGLQLTEIFHFRKLIIKQ